MAIKQSENGSLGSFISEISELAPDTKYYIRAYASNAVGTGYGNEISFSTLKASTPELTTQKFHHWTKICKSQVVPLHQITDLQLLQEASAGALK